MPPANHRHRTFVYKQATYTHAPGPHVLETLLNELWQATTRSGQRRQLLNSDDGTSIVTAYRAQRHQMTFFELWAFTPGMKALAARIDFDANALDAQQVDLRNDAGQELQLIENMAHLAVCGNDVVVVPSAALRPPEIEAHLTWLIAQHAAPDRRTPVFLSNRLQPARELRVRQAKSLEFSTHLPLQAVPDPAGALALRPVGQPWEIVKSALRTLGGGMADLADELEVEDLTASTPVEIAIKLSWKRTRQQPTHALMDKIVTGLRHLDTELDYRIETTNGPLTKDDIILRRHRTVRCIAERPQRDDLFEKMADWLIELKTEGLVA